ncbi:MAG TPA: YafY family protein [Clostridia bacterium]|nr:YafY family protein [Clostridia bacterium]
MRIDRLLGIVCHLLRQDSATAAQLAQRFEVSARTIQRDMDALSVAGIPVTSTVGSRGGYSILPEYRLGQVATDADYASLVVAMRGLCTAYGGKDSEQTLDKLLALPVALQSPTVTLDLSAAREQPEVAAILETVSEAVRSEICLSFLYENAQGASSARRVEPLRLMYQWYAWYLFAYDRDRAAYRLFKLARMRDVQPAGQGFSRRHGDVDALLARQQDLRPCTEVRLRCKASVRTAVLEYLRGEVLQTYPDNSFELRIQVLQDEHMWWGLLLSFGADVAVLAPESLRRRVAEHAEALTCLYAADQSHQ